METNNVRLTVFIDGVKARCRKTDFHQFKGPLLGTKSIAEAETLARDFFKSNAQKYKAAMKRIDRVRLNLQPVKVDEISESFVIFSHKSVEVTSEVQS